MANDIVRPSCDELVVFEEGNMECEMSSHLTKAPIPDRGTQHYVFLHKRRLLELATLYAGMSTFWARQGTIKFLAGPEDPESPAK